MALGVDSSVTVAKEGTYGTPATTAFYTIPFTSEGFQVNINRGKSNNIVSGASYSSVYSLGQSVAWTLNGDALYNRLDHLIYGVMGSVSTVAGTAADTGAFTNTFTPATTLPGFTFEISKGNIPASKVYVYKGCKVSRLELSGNDTGAVSFSAQGVGLDEVSTNPGGSAASGSPVALDATYLTDPILVSVGTTRDIGTGASGDYCVKSFKLTIDRKLQVNDFCIGSTTPNEPLAEDFMDVSGEFTIKFIDRLVYNDFMNQTDLSAELKFVSASKAVSGGTLARTLDIFINKLRYDAPGGLVLVDKPGVLIARVPFTAYGTSGSTTSTQPIAFQTIDDVKADTAL